MNKPKIATKARNADELKYPLNEKTRARMVAEIGLAPVTGNVSTARNFLEGMLGKLDLNECITVMTEYMAKVNTGDLTGIENTLIGQATALDAIFNELARRAALNMGEYLQATETYLRLALKAQGQCRATLQTLAEIKNPRPVAFVKQANISNGPQQVNNGEPRSVPAHRAGESDNSANKLLEVSNEKRLDFGAASATGGTDPTLEAVGAVNRA